MAGDWTVRSTQVATKMEELENSEDKRILINEHLTFSRINSRVS